MTQTADKTGLVRCDNCGRYGWHTTDRCPEPTAQINPYPDVAPPTGATRLDAWQPDDPQSYRVVFGADRTVTDHRLTVSSNVVQFADGSIDGGRVEAPHVYVFGVDEGNPLNSDQARELASVLLVAAAEIDGWAAR